MIVSNGGPAPAAATFECHILVVDDNENNLRAMEAVLRDLSCTVWTVNSGSHALRLLLERDFNLIILDVDMPEMDGIELAGMIRRREKTRNLPIIFVTAHEQTDSRVLQAYGLGAVDFLFKPLVAEIVRAKVVVLIELQVQAARLHEHELREERRRFDEELQQVREEALRKDAEQQRRLAEESAARAREMAALAAEREKANAELQEVDRFRNRFIASLAHELRNPLAPLAYAVGLLEGYDDRVIAEVRTRMSNQLSHLRRLLDDLLDVSRIQHGSIRLQRTPIDLRASIEEAIQLSSSELTARHHRLDVELGEQPLMLEGDHTRLVQVISNLLNNAARYTDQGGRIAVRARRDGSAIRLEVSDDGQGIRPELLHEVFGEFVKADPNGPGLGLGLHLVKTLVDLHGGRVTARSDGPGRGSTFVVELPASSAAPQAVAPEPEVARTQSNLRIVVVEDQADVRAMMVLLLEKWGHEVREAEDGEEGVDLILETQPDVALVDIGLPGIDGYEVCRAVRSSRVGHAPFLAAVTGWGQPEDRQRAADAGFDGHLLKPVSAKELRRLLSSVSPS